MAIEKLAFPRLLFQFRWREPLPALGTPHSFKIDPLNLGGRDRAAALRAEGIDGCQDLFEIDFLLPGHQRSPRTKLWAR